MDDTDVASEREEIERNSRIEAARKSNPAAVPVLDCVECSGITQDAAKTDCQHFAHCVADWQKIQLHKRINGNGLV